MSSIRKSLLALALLSLAACASSPGQKDEADRQARTKVFFEGLQPARAVDASGSCHSVSSGAKTMTSVQSWKSLVDEASACVKASNWQAVDGWAFELSRSYADSPWGLYFYSVAAEATKDEPRALWMIDAAMKKSNSEIAIFRYQKARVLWSIKPSESALKEAQAALDLDASLVDAHNFIGDARLRTEDYKTAALHYEAALKLSAGDTHALQGLTMIEVQTGKPVAERAIASQAAGKPAPAAAKSVAPSAKNPATNPDGYKESK